MAQWDLDINIDFSYSRTMDSDMVLESSLCLVVMVPGVSKGHQISQSPVAVCIRGPNMDPRGGLAHWDQPGPQRQQEPWISTQILDTVGPGTPAWPLAAAQPGQIFPSVYSLLPSPRPQAASSPPASAKSSLSSFLPFRVFLQNHPLLSLHFSTTHFLTVVRPTYLGPQGTGQGPSWQTLEDPAG